MRGGGRDGEVQIVVHGLPYAMVWQGLKDLIREHSRVEAARATITMGSDGRSKGWGLVLLRSMEDAQAAIQVCCRQQYTAFFVTILLCLVDLQCTL